MPGVLVELLGSLWGGNDDEEESDTGSSSTATSGSEEEEEGEGQEDDDDDEGESTEQEFDDLRGVSVRSQRTRTELVNGKAKIGNSRPPPSSKPASRPRTGPPPSAQLKETQAQKQPPRQQPAPPPVKTSIRTFPLGTTPPSSSSGPSPPSPSPATPTTPPSTRDAERSPWSGFSTINLLNSVGSKMGTATKANSGRNSVKSDADAALASLGILPTTTTAPTPPGSSLPSPSRPGHSRAMEQRGADPRGLYHVPAPPPEPNILDQRSRHASTNSLANSSDFAVSEVDSGYLAGTSDSEASFSVAPSGLEAPVSPSLVGGKRAASFPYIPPDLALRGQARIGDDDENADGKTPMGLFGQLPNHLVSRILDLLDNASLAPFLVVSKPLRRLVLAHQIRDRNLLGVVAVLSLGKKQWTAWFAGHEVLPDGTVALGNHGVRVLPFPEEPIANGYRAKFPTPSSRSRSRSVEEDEGERGKGKQEVLRVLDTIGWPGGAPPSPLSSRSSSGTGSTSLSDGSMFEDEFATTGSEDEESDDSESTATGSTRSSALIFSRKRPQGGSRGLAPDMLELPQQPASKPPSLVASLSSLFSKPEEPPVLVAVSELFSVCGPKKDLKGKGPPPQPGVFPGDVNRIFRGNVGGHGDSLVFSRGDPNMGGSRYSLFRSAAPVQPSLKVCMGATLEWAVFYAPRPNPGNEGASTPTSSSSSSSRKNAPRIVGARTTHRLLLSPHAPISNGGPPPQLFPAKLANLRRYMRLLTEAGFSIPLDPRAGIDRLVYTHPRFCAGSPGKGQSGVCEGCEAIRTFLRDTAADEEDSRIQGKKKVGEEEGEAIRSCAMRIVGALGGGKSGKVEMLGAQGVGSAIGSKIVGKAKEEDEGDDYEEDDSPSRGLIWEAWQGWNGR